MSRLNLNINSLLGDDPKRTNRLNLDVDELIGKKQNGKVSELPTQDPFKEALQKTSVLTNQQPVGFQEPPPENIPGQEHPENILKFYQDIPSMGGIGNFLGSALTPETQNAVYESVKGGIDEISEGSNMSIGGQTFEDKLTGKLKVLNGLKNLAMLPITATDEVMKQNPVSEWIWSGVMFPFEAIDLTHTALQKGTDFAIKQITGKEVDHDSPLFKVVDELTRFGEQALVGGALFHKAGEVMRKGQLPEIKEMSYADYKTKYESEPNYIDFEKSQYQQYKDILQIPERTSADFYATPDGEILTIPDYIKQTEKGKKLQSKIETLIQKDIRGEKLTPQQLDLIGRIKKEIPDVKEIVEENAKRPFTEPPKVIGEKLQQFEPDIEIADKVSSYQKAIEIYDTELRTLDEQLSHSNSKEQLESLSEQYKETESKKSAWQKRIDETRPTEQPEIKVMEEVGKKKIEEKIDNAKSLEEIKEVKEQFKTIKEKQELKSEIEETKQKIVPKENQLKDIPTDVIEQSLDDINGIPTKQISNYFFDKIYDKLSNETKKKLAKQVKANLDLDIKELKNEFNIDVPIEQLERNEQGIIVLMKEAINRYQRELKPIGNLEIYQSAKQTIKDALKKDSGISFGGLSKLTDLTDPKVLKAVYDVAKYHTGNFGQWARKVLKDVGEWIRPHLRTLYNEAIKNRTGLENITTMGFSPSSKAQFYSERLAKGFSRDEVAKQWKEAQTKDIEVKKEIIKKNVETQPVEEPPVEIKSIEDIKKINVPKTELYIKGDKPAGEDVFNYNNFSTNPELNELFKRVAEENKPSFDTQKRDVRSWDRTDVTSDELILNKFITKEKLLETKPGNIANADYTDGASKLLNHQARNVFNMAKNIKPEDINGKIELVKQYLDLVGMLKNFKGLVSEAGRSLNIMKKVNNDNLPQFTAIADRLKEYGIDAKDLTEFTNKAIEIIEPTFKDKFWYVWYNSMLSNPFSYGANIGGNVSNVSFEGFKNVLTQTPRETAIMLRNLPSGFIEGGKRYAKALKDEELQFDKFDFQTKKYLEVFRPKSKIGKTFKAILPTTQLKAQDMFFREVLGSMRRPLVERDISKLTGDPLSQVKKTLDDIAKNPSLAELDKKFALYDKHLKSLNDYIDYGVFQQSYGKFGQSVANVLDTNVGQFLKFPMPFPRIFTNIGKVSARTTPYGTLRDIALNKNRNQLTNRQKRDVYGRALAGSMIYSAIIYMLANEIIDITGTGPANRDEREQWLKAGNQPNSIQIKYNGQKHNIAYQNINPLNIPLALIGNYLDEERYNKNVTKEQRKNFAEKLGQVLLNSGQTYFDQSFLKTTDQLIEDMREGDIKGIARWVYGLAIPNIVSFPKQVNELTSGEEKTRYEKSYNPVDFLKEKTGLTEGMKEQIAPFGTPRQSKYERFPIPKKADADAVANMLLEKDIVIGDVGKGTKIDNEVVTDEQYRQLQEQSNKDVTEFLATNYAKINAMTKEEAEDFVKNEVSKIREQNTLDLKNKTIPKKTEIENPFEIILK